MNREEIINEYSKNEFMSFLQNDYSGQILELFNNEGLDILYNSPRREERIQYIITFSKYINELLENNDFLEVFLDSDINSYYAVLRNLKPETYDKMLKKYSETTTNSENIAQLFSYFNIDYKLQLLDNWPYNEDILYAIINEDESEVINKIVNKYDIDLSDKRIRIVSLITKAKESVLKEQTDRNNNDTIRGSINIPVHTINKELGKRLWESYDIFEIRKIINDLEYSTNPEEVNNYIKQKEETVINNYNENTFNYPYKEIFESYRKMKEAKEKEDEDNYYDYRMQYIRLVNRSDIKDIHEQIENNYQENNIEGVFNYLKELSNRELSNYIIDYNFEENYHNIIIDIRELLRFYYDGNIVLPEERVELYEQVSNIDYLTIEEKKELHNRLKKINIKELFYDDMSYARHIVHEAIKEYSLTRETIKQYKDEELSKKLGVDVYKVNEEPFFGIVKTRRHPQDKLPTGHSYSLVGNNCVAVFGDAKDGETFLYDTEDLNPDQIVHAFPFDSYTFFRPFERTNDATNRIHPLMTPEEITGVADFSYSEVLILEQGREQTDIDEKIPELKRIALYCIDEIREQDVEKAKEKGVGIILVNSRKYIQGRNYYKEKYKYLDRMTNDQYFDGKSEKDKFEARR